MDVNNECCKHLASQIVEPIPRIDKRRYGTLTIDPQHCPPGVPNRSGYCRLAANSNSLTIQMLKVGSFRMFTKGRRRMKKKIHNIEIKDKRRRVQVVTLREVCLGVERNCRTIRL